MPKKWWYDAIKNTLADLKEGVGFGSNMADYAEQMREHLMQMIVLEQPYGHVEYDPENHYARPPNYTVSDRLGHTPIDLGWRPEYSGLDDAVGIRLKLTNVSQHIKYVLEGARAHEIPAEYDKKVHFWWGEPQPWPAPDYHAVTGEDMGPDYYTYMWIRHPGQKRNPFVRRAVRLAKPEMTDTIQTGVTNYITNLMESSGLRQVQ